MCDEARNAGTVDLPVSRLQELALENAYFWRAYVSRSLESRLIAAQAEIATLRDSLALRNELYDVERAAHERAEAELAALRKQLVDAGIHKQNTRRVCD